MKSKIKEIFYSIQGEGPYIGQGQVFVRFCNCNLFCMYCDTDFSEADILGEMTPEELCIEVQKTSENNCKTLSLTGGEPLLQIDFLEEFLPISTHEIYLETNGTLPEELERIVSYIDIISMDIKLPSTTGCGDFFNEHEKFIEIAQEANKEIFAKSVFNKFITAEEIEKTITLCKKANIELILQPETKGDNIIDTNGLMFIFNSFASKYDKVRLIPQVHKILTVK